MHNLAWTQDKLRGLLRQGENDDQVDGLAAVQHGDARPYSTGVGFRAGAKVGYLHCETEYSWFPF